ncbi:MAG: discoidin domain-containing protein [Pseudanabaena sp.]
MFTPPVISKTLVVTAFTAFMSLSATSVSAINLIPNVTASTNTTSAFGTLIGNTVNGAGLTGNTPALTGLHGTPDPGNSYFALNASSPTPQLFTFNLNGSYNLGGFSFWNLNSGTPSIGIKDVNISTSTDGSVFTSLVGAPTVFAIGATNASANPEIFAFSPTTASYVRFAVTSNYGDAFTTGFNEVQFNSAATPVPFDFDPSLGVVSLGVVFGINKWRKNKNKDLKK